MNAIECPQRERLSAYLLGELPEEEVERLVRHVEECADCETVIDALESGSDTLVGRIRQPQPVDPFAVEPECNEALARAARMGPECSAESGSMRCLGQYRLLERLGHGGMGTVYKARHEKLDRIVALKVLHKHRMVDQHAIARFEREMKAVGSLEHPNIVRATDAGEVDDVPYLVMEHVDGWDLSALIRRLGPLPVADACEIVRQAAIALQAAHERGLVHRDVKPSNLMLDREGRVRLLDLGLARFQQTPAIEGHPTEEEMTDTGQVMGTADYMAPEQADDSHSADIRADIFALGGTLFKLLSGRRPFVGEAREPAPSIRQYRQDVPRPLFDVIERALATDPAERFQVPESLAEALEPFCTRSDLVELTQREPDYPPVPTPMPQPAAAGHGGRFWAMIVALMLFAGGLGMALGILLTIKHNGQTTTVEVPDGANVKVDDTGNVEVELPRSVDTPAAPAAAIVNLKVIGLAMHNYHDVHGNFPPAYSTDAEGKPLLSWRVLVLPHIEPCPEHKALYEKFKLDEPWDSPHNRKLADTVVQAYRAPGTNTPKNMTNYLTVRGEKTVFPGKEKTEYKDISDGLTYTIMFVEASDEAAVLWTRPDDFEYDEEDPTARLMGLHPNEFHVAMCDGRVHSIPNSINHDVLKRLFTRDGWEPIDFDRLDQPPRYAPLAKPEKTGSPIERALRSRVSFNLDGTPLSDFVAYIEDSYKIEVDVDWKAIAESRGENTPEPTVTMDIQGLTLLSALRRISCDLNLKYDVRDDVLLITTRQPTEQPW